MRLRTLLAGTTVAIAALLMLTASPALAATPSNDTFAGTAVIGSIPFSTSLDTTEATTDADDASANSTCGAPATDASVWYSLTPATDTGLIVDVSASTFSPGVIVVTGTPGSFTLVTCGPGAVGFGAVAGSTYHLLLFDFQGDGGGNGGILNLSVSEIPPPPVIDVTVNPTAQFSQEGSAILSGTVQCTGGPAEFAVVQGELSQKVGRVATVRGFFGTPVTCDGEVRPWQAEVFPQSGQFRGGKGASVTFAFACGIVQCSFDFEERTVQLSRSH